ncbi:MAG: ABC transporter ATP-binding protein [Deltaproteobacteria bacterium]|nr:ABC transporter ATP-binding protein [Deltaproteobacteria bacterium]
MIDDHGPIGRIPIRGRFRLIRDSLSYVKPEKADEFRYRDILYFARYLYPLRGVIAVSLLLTFLTSALSAAFPLSGKWIVDYIFMKGSIQPIISALKDHHLGSLAPVAGRVLTSLPWLLAALMVIQAVKYLAGNELSLLNYRINTEYGYRVKMAVFSRVMRYPLSYFKSTRSGYLLARINSDAGGLSSVSGSFLNVIVTSSMSLVVSASVLITLSRPLTWFVVLSVPLTVVLSYYITKFHRSYQIRMRESGLRLSADGQDLINTIDLIKTHAAEERELARYAQATKENIALNIANMIFGQVTGGVRQALGYGVKLGVMLYGGSQVLDGRMTIGDYTAFLTMYPQLTGAITSFLQMPISMQHTAISAGRVKELLDLATEYEHEDPTRRLLYPKAVAAGDIRCEQVGFGYGDGAAVLTDVEMHIRPGERIALVGPTGSGKTTLINLLLKFYRPQSGHIYIDGYDSADLNPAWIREQIGLVSQDLMLFHDTIFNNIRYSRPEADEAEVMAAARSAGIHGEITAFPEGYDTVVGERGGKLSGGQKQRIAIARAFLRNAPIMILDEPTAHLDLATEAELLKEFVKICAGRTTIIITHRESLLHLADRVYELRQGRVQLRS